MDASQIITVFGIALPVCATVAAWLWRTHHERETVKVALVAEIIALKQIASIRRYVKDLEEAADELKKIPELDRPTVQFQVNVPEHYCRIYVASVGKLGALSLVDAQLVVRFYQYADSVVSDIAPGGRLYEGTNDPNAFLENAVILKEAIAIADEIELRHPL